MVKITREESKIMQGVAILMMIFVHLFNPGLISEYTDTFVGICARGQNPVPLYTFLSGFGLWCVYSRATKDKQRLMRCVRLYARYWLIAACFIVISISVGKMGGG